jgi:ankyrin repeat protein
MQLEIVSSKNDLTVGDVDIVLLLLQSGAQITDYNHWGWSPLHFAASSGSIELVQLLLEEGASPYEGFYHNR